MKAGPLLTTLWRLRVLLAAEQDNLVVCAPRGALTPELRTALHEHKPVILSALRLAGPHNPVELPHLLEAQRATTHPDAASHNLPDHPCHHCGSASWWKHRSGGNWLCGRCHPNPQETNNANH